MKEYLSTLNTRNKWNEEKGNIAPSDVVLMVDPGNSRGHWPLSRIQEVLPGPDGKVKVVRVRTGKDYVTNHKVVSVRDIKRTKGTEHSPVRGGGTLVPAKAWHQHQRRPLGRPNKTLHVRI